MSPTSRAVLGILALALCLLLAGVFLAGDQSVQIALAMVDQLSIVAWTGLILLAATCFGAALLRLLKLRPAEDGAAALFGLGLGLAVLSTLLLVLGSLGFLSKVSWVVVLMAFLFIGLHDLGVFLRALPAAFRRVRAASGFRLALWTVLGFFLLLNLTRAYEPPWAYDVTEYHLAAPAQYHQAGRVFFIRDNAYANFPQNMEMLYCLSMSLTGSSDRGALVGQMLCAALGFLAALALRRMVAGVAGKTAGDLAAAFFYTWPAITVYSGLAYVELPLMFYATLGLWALVWSWRRKRTRPGARGWVILAGIAAGAAMGVKYTAALLVFIPVLFWIAGLGFVAGIAPKEILRRAALFAGVAFLCFSPWLIRNFADTRDPVYPLLYKMSGSTNFDAQKDARWTQAHSPNNLSAGNFIAQARETIFFDERNASLLLWLFIPFALLTRRWSRLVALLLAGNALILFFLWFFFTQQIVRFLEIGFPMIAALSAIGLAAVLPSRRALGLKQIVILLLILGPSRWVVYLNVERSLGCALGSVSTDEYFQTRPTDFRYGYDAMKFVNEKLPENSKVLFLGEARTFYCRRPFVASTVFDTNRLQEIVAASKTPADIRDRLLAMGVTHLYVDTAELRRLQSSYSYTFAGRERLGMLDGFDWELFGQFATDHLRAVWTYPPAAQQVTFPWERWPEFLKLAAGGERVGNFIAIYEIR